MPEESTYDICTKLVTRHKELKHKNLINEYSENQDTDLYNSLDDLEQSMKKFESGMSGFDEGGNLNAH